MKTKTIEVYKFSELSELAKQTAIENYIDGNNDCDYYADERNASYKAAKEIYKQLHNIDGEIKGGRLVAYIVNNFSHLWIKSNYISKHADGQIKNSYFLYKYDNPIKARVSNIFKTNNLENCPLTGVCYDFDFLQPIIDFLKNPDKETSNTDLDIPDYEQIAQRDIDYQNSDEYITEILENQDTEYTQDGKIFNY